jgi:FtsH-binding integral membrane protein
LTDTRRNQLRFVLVFVALYGLILFLIRPDPTRAQTIFRLTLVGVGVLGLVWVKKRESK